jgi:hypothetical protein
MLLDIDTTKASGGGISNLSFPQILIGLIVISILVVVIYYATNKRINIFNAILSYFKISVGEGEKSDEIASMEGEYSYKCWHNNKSNIPHEHGGYCKLETTIKQKDVFLWRLNGKRTWRQDGDKKTNFDDNSFIAWHSTHAVIFPDKTFIFRYEISIDGMIRPGFAHGSIITKNINKAETITELNGMYFQYDGNEIVEGQLKVKRHL